MIDKKRRDITLGEMQDECGFRGRDCTTLGGGMCDYFDVCESMHNKKDNFQSPCDWGLTDPPRFTEAQMAFWRGWYAMGAAFVRRWKDGNIWFVNEQGDDVGTIKSNFDLVDILEIGETLDLADLLGKDGADEKA